MSSSNSLRPPAPGTPNTSGSPSKAPLACGTCRRQKRKCDKSLPSCGLCVRMRRPCDYSEAQPAPTSEDFTALQLRLIELESRLSAGSGGGSPALSGASIGATTPPLPTASAPAAASYFTTESTWQATAPVQFPPEVFLDSEAWQSLNRPCPKPYAEIPGDVLVQIGDGSTIQQTITDYFASIHPWFPILSKQRMHSGASLFESGPDLAMLFLAVKLVTMQPVEGIPASDHYIYTTAKRFLSMLEHSGYASIMLLQSMALVALYEYGHGIYPAAWTTVGNCARYTEHLGLPDLEQSAYLLNQVQTMAEVEERRRAWWAVVVLDRLVSLGNNKRCFLLDPPDWEELPISEQAWDEGNIPITGQRTVVDRFTATASPFSRLCEASVLASTVLKHIRGRPTIRTTPDKPLPVDEALGLLEQLYHASSVVDAEASIVFPTSSFSPPMPLSRSHSPQSTAPGMLAYSAIDPYKPAQFLLLSLTLKLQKTYCDPVKCTPISALEASFQHRFLSECNVLSSRALSLFSEIITQRSASTAHARQRSPTPCSSTHLTAYHSLYSTDTATTPGEADDPFGLEITFPDLSPLILDAVYTAATTVGQVASEEHSSASPEAMIMLDTAKQQLRQVGARWRVAAEYERMLRERFDGTALLH